MFGMKNRPGESNQNRNKTPFGLQKNITNISINMKKKRGADQIYNDAMWLFIVSSSPTCAVWLKQAARCT